MVRRDVVGRKVANAEARLRQARERFDRPQAEFLADVENRDLASFYLFLAIQECIDLAVHWVADAGWGPPDDYGSTFDILAAHGVIPEDLADAMRSATGLRNRIGHDYARLDHDRLYRELGEGIQALERFLAAVSDEADL